MGKNSRFSIGFGRSKVDKKDPVSVFNSWSKYNQNLYAKWKTGEEPDYYFSYRERKDFIALSELEEKTGIDVLNRTSDNVVPISNANKKKKLKPWDKWSIDKQNRYEEWSTGLLTDFDLKDDEFEEFVEREDQEFKDDDDDDLPVVKSVGKYYADKYKDFDYSRYEDMDKNWWDTAGGGYIGSSYGYGSYYGGYSGYTSYIPPSQTIEDSIHKILFKDFKSYMRELFGYYSSIGDLVKKAELVDPEKDPKRRFKLLPSTKTGLSLLTKTSLMPTY